MSRAVRNRLAERAATNSWNAASGRSRTTMTAPSGHPAASSTWTTHRGPVRVERSTAARSAVQRLRDGGEQVDDAVRSVDDEVGALGDRGHLGGTAAHQQAGGALRAEPVDCVVRRQVAEVVADEH